jgi:aminopeptidase C
MRELDSKILNSLKSKLDNSQARIDISNAISENGIESIARKRGKTLDFDFDKKLNVIHLNGNSTLDLFISFCENFTNQKISKKWLMFWERIERSNLVLEYLIENNFQIKQSEINKKLDTWLNKNSEWNSYEFLTEKYGLVEHDKKNNIVVSSPTMLDRLISTKLKQNTALLTRMIDRNMDNDFVLAKKNKAISDIYNMLVYCLGIEFENNKPVNNVPSSNFICIVNLPGFEQDNNFRFDGAKTAVEEDLTEYYNLDFDIIKNLIKKQINSGKPVLFFSENIDYELGSHIEDMFDMNETVATCMDLDKAKRINFGISGIKSISQIVAFKEMDSKLYFNVFTNGNYVICDEFWLHEYCYKYYINNNVIDEISIQLDEMEKKVIDNEIIKELII